MKSSEQVVREAWERVDTPPQPLTVRDAVWWLQRALGMHVSIEQMKRWIRAGELTVLRDRKGRAWFTKRELEALVDHQRTRIKELLS